MLFERYIVYNIFNKELCYYLLEVFYTYKEIRDGVVLVSKIQVYQELFGGVLFRNMVVSKMQLFNRNEKAIILKI